MTFSSKLYSFSFICLFLTLLTTKTVISLQFCTLNNCWIRLLIFTFFPLSLPPECHHESRDPHKCHFGDCPACRQTCKKVHAICGHQCPAPCHSAVLVKIQAQKGSMPWENTSEQLQKRALPCPDCVVPVPITCFGM